MIQTQATRVTFTKNYGFRKELNKRVDAYFKSQNIGTRDNPAMYLKTLVIFAWVIAAWTFVVFGPPEMWLKAIGCVFLGCGIAAVGFSVGHDANHGGYSSRPWVNSALGLTYDVIGVSSYLWRYRHNFLHHTFTNILGHDVEIHGDDIVRMTPYVEYKSHHSFQHIFISFIYSIVPLYWAISDIKTMIFKRRYHDHPIPTPKPLDIFTLFAGKLIWLGIFIGIPIAVGYTPLQALAGFLITYMTYGVLICNIFMLAHVMEGVEFIEPDPDSLQVDDEWAVFQIRTTIDFAPRNHFLNWYLGGLNYQVVHHLFPQVCHIHYPKIAPILAEVCEEFGVKYSVYPTFKDAITANYSWLKRMGTPVEQN